MSAQLKYKTLKELEDKIKDYQDKIEKSGETPTIAGCAYHLGMDRTTFYAYETRDTFATTIKKTRDWVISKMEQHATHAKASGGVIFLLKNYGYTDRQDINQTITVEELSDEQRVKKIKSLQSRLEDNITEGDFRHAK